MTSQRALRCWLRHLAGREDGRAGAPTAAEWGEIAGLAELHNLRPLTYRRVTDGPFAASIPSEVAEGLRSAYLETAVRNALILKHSARAITALAAAGIEAIPLKGLHLCRFVYPEPALRGMADVDLLLRRDRLAEAERIFVEQGFGPLPRPDLDEFCGWSNHLAKLIKQGEPVYELHWHVERPLSSFEIDLDGLWARSTPAELEGAPVRTLAAEDLFHHVALHGAYHHSFQRSAFRMIVDLHAILAARGASFDWPALVERANAWGTARYLFVALRVTGSVLELELPMDVLGELEHGREEEQVAGQAHDFLLGLGAEVPDAYLALARTTGLWERAKHILRHTFPGRPEMERIYGLAPGAWLAPRYVARLGHLIATRTGLLLSSLTGREVRRAAFDRESARRLIEDWTGSRPGPPGD